MIIESGSGFTNVPPKAIIAIVANFQNLPLDRRIKVCQYANLRQSRARALASQNHLLLAMA